MKDCARTVITSVFSAVLLIIALQGAAQSNGPLSSYTPHIIAKVADINGLLNLTDQKQMALANYFARQDSLAMAKKKAGKPLEEIAACYKTDGKALHSILDTQQLGTIRLKNRLINLEPGEEYSPLNGTNIGMLIAKAISYREQLQLADEQINKLANWLMAYLQTGMQQNRVPTLEKKELMAVLSETQFAKFTEEEGRRDAESKVAVNYRILKSQGLVTSKTDTVALKSTLLSYEMKLQAAREKYQITKSKEDLVAARAIEKAKPAILGELAPAKTKARKKPAFAW